MSDLDTATPSKKARLIAVILIAAMAVFSAIAIIQSNVLQWPLTSGLGSLVGHQNTPQSNQNKNMNSDSFILVSAIARLPFIAEVPLSGANVTVYLNATSPRVGPGTPQGHANVKGFPIASNVTDVNGQIRFKVSAGNYKVTMTSDIANVTASVSTKPQNTTELDIQVNETSYSASYFEIQNEATPGLLLPWDSTFLSIDSIPKTNGNANESIFLSFLTPSVPTTTTCIGLVCTVNLTCASAFCFQQMVSVRLINEFSSPTQDELWLQVQTNSVVNITEISGIDVLISFSSYTLKEYPSANPAAQITTSVTST